MGTTIISFPNVDAIQIPPPSSQGEGGLHSRPGKKDKLEFICLEFNLKFTMWSGIKVLGINLGFVTNITLSSHKVLTYRNH